MQTNPNIQIMSKRPFDTNQNKMSRNDRFVQMSQQEMLIEQKKREIQAKLEAKRRQNNQETKEIVLKPPPVIAELPTPSNDASQAGVNQFSNDGSFLNQFKQLKTKKNDSKFKTFNKYKDRERAREREKEKEREQEREKEKEKDTVQDSGTNSEKDEPQGRSTSPVDRNRRPSRFSAEPLSTLDHQKITFSTSFTNNPPPPLSHFSQSAPFPQSQQGLDSETSPLLGTNPTSVQTQPLLNDYSVPTQISLASAENTDFTSPQISSIGPHLPNIPPPTAQLITPAVTQQLPSTETIPSLIQQPLGIIAQPPPSLPLHNYSSTNMPSTNFAAPNLPAQNFPTANFSAPNLPTPNLSVPSLPGPNLPVPNLPAPNLPSPNLPAPNLPGPNLPAPNLSAPNFSAPNFPAPDLPAGNFSAQNLPSLDLPTPNFSAPPAEIGPVNLSAAATSLQQTQTVMTQALPTSTHLFAAAPGTEQIVSTPSQVLLSVPPPQILPQTQLVLTTQDQNVLVSAPTSILTTVTLPPPVIAPQNLNVSTPNVINVRSGLSTVELTSIPPPNPIQIQNIPQPEPINTLNIPPPAPLQVSTIPTPSSLQLNEIPNPKPIDLMAIPTPNEDDENSFTGTNFLKNIPPPNRNLPPPIVTDMKFLSPPPQQGQVSGSSSITSLSTASAPQSSVTRIPSLMSQRVLPPPGMGISIPPPMIHTRDVSQPPPNFNMQAPPPMPNLNVPPPIIAPPPEMPHRGSFKEEISGGAEFEAMANLARMVAECGPSVEDVVRQKKNRDPELWFLFHKDSSAYRQYANLVEQYKKEREDNETMEMAESKPDPSEIYEPEMALEDDEYDQDSKDGFEVKQEIKQENYCNSAELFTRRDRKRKSRWGEKDHDVKPPVVLPVLVPPITTIMPPVPGTSIMLSKLTRNDPGLLHYAVQSYGTTNLSDEDWKKAEDNYKIHLLYQDMLRKREELERLERQGKNKYDYDSDEETEGGTWEHKLRVKEMQATERWAVELTKQAEGKHHIGDFLPPEELKRFMEKSNAVKEGRQPNFSDYKEFKIKEDNIGFKMLQKLGWAEGQGLGQNNAGIVEPVNKGAPRENTQGLGLNLNEATEGEDEYESYRKRMMLAYRFRPNPLNNPRRPYY